MLLPRSSGHGVAFLIHVLVSGGEENKYICHLSPGCGLDGPPVAVAEEHTSCPDWWPLVAHPAHCGPALNSGFPVQIATISFCDNEPSRRQGQPAGCCGVLVQNGYGDPHNARPIYHFGILSDSDSESESKIGIALNSFPASVPHLHQDGTRSGHQFIHSHYHNK